MGRDWAEFRERDDDDRPGTWLRLPVNGWGCLVAFSGGPERVRRVARSQGSVKVVRHGDGPEVTTYEDYGPQERAEDRRVLAEYLLLVGVPLPPDDTSWELLLPPAVSPEKFVGAVNNAIAAVPGPLPSPEVRRAVERVVAALAPR